MIHGEAITPQTTVDASWSFTRTRVLVTAVELDLFTHIEKGFHTVSELAKAAQATSRGVRMVVDALAAMGLLMKAGNRYGLTETARRYLSRGSPGYLGGLVLHMNQLEGNWMHLTDVVRTGRPVMGVETAEDQGEFFSQFVGALHALNAPAAEAVAHRVLEQYPKSHNLRVLDIGAGSGVWGFAFGRLNPRAHITVADWPRVIDTVTREHASRAGLEERVDYLPGNFREVEFPDDRYDVAILGHICHSEGAENTRRMFHRLRQALRPEGQLVIVDWLPDPQRAEAVFPLLFAINMLVHTREGDVFTFEEYRDWLENAGFENVAVLANPTPSPVIVARSRAIAQKVA